MTGCAHQPVVTQSLIESQQFADCGKPLRTVFIDDRDARFKTEKIIVRMGFPVASANMLGDQCYDLPLNVAFEKMVIKRFGSTENGFNTEFKLKAFYASFKFNDFVGVPFLGLLAAGADVEWSGILRVDVGLMDNENMFVLNKTYDVSFTEMRPANEKLGEASLDIIQKLFSKFARDFEGDVSRTRLPSHSIKGVEATPK
jgi:hypothetical protein